MNDIKAIIIRGNFSEDELELLIVLLQQMVADRENACFEIAGVDPRIPLEMAMSKPLFAMRVE